MFTCNLEDNDAVDAVVYWWKIMNNKDRETMLSNKRLEEIRACLLNQLEKYGFLTYGYIHERFHISVPDKYYCYKFYTGDREKWKKDLESIIYGKKNSLIGIKANAEGLKKQAEHYKELYERESKKAEELENDIQKLEEILG